MWFLFVSKYNVTFSDLLNVKHLNSDKENFTVADVNLKVYLSLSSEMTPFGIVLKMW